MGFNIKINSILKTNDIYDLKVGGIYAFKKQGSRVYFDNIPIWLTNDDWTVLADISIVSQSKEDGQTSGKFRVDYIYEGDEQQVISQMFIRLYGGISDPYIYLLASQEEYQKALKVGILTRDSLESEGFIHASPKNQLNRVANKFYNKVEQPIILLLDKKKITAEVKWEPATGGLYPHIYGPLNMDSVVKQVPISLKGSGSFEIDISSF